MSDGQLLFLDKVVGRRERKGTRDMNNMEKGWHVSELSWEWPGLSG